MSVITGSLDFKGKLIEETYHRLVQISGSVDNPETEQYTGTQYLYDGRGRKVTLDSSSISDVVYTNIPNQTIDGNLIIRGHLAVEQFIISSSVSHYTQSFYSGSSNFGDTQDHIHQFTGSVNITGSLTATSFSGDGSGLTNIPAGNLPNGLLSGSAQIASEISGAFISISSSISTRFINHDNYIYDIMLINS